jgi:hypothetical protein
MPKLSRNKRAQICANLEFFFSCFDWIFKGLV